METRTRRDTVTVGGVANRRWRNRLWDLSFLAAVVILALAGCGGSSGGGGGSGGGSGSSGGGGSGGGGSGGGGSGGGGGGGPSPPNTNGAASVLFPATGSSVSPTRTLVIAGTATDPEGIARVQVNGVDAMTTPINPPSMQDVTWSSIPWPLNVGANTLTVSVEDTAGNVLTVADTVTIRYGDLEIPTTFTLDPDGTRVVGLSFTFTPGGSAQNLVEYNYATAEREIYDLDAGAPSLSCLRRFENEFLYLVLQPTEWELRSYSLTSRQDALLTALPAGALDGGAGFEEGSVRQLVCGGTQTSAYVLVNHREVGGSFFAKSRILEIELSTSNVSTLTDGGTTVPRWIARHIALADDSIVGLFDVSPSRPLTNISLADGSRADLAPGLNVAGSVLQPELANDRVYVANFLGIDEIDLGGGTQQNLSPVAADDPLSFSQPRAIGFDAANNRLVVGDSDLEILVAVDTTTGERSTFLSANVGSGIGLVAPRAMAISSDGTRAYVADDGQNRAERLFEIDLANGDRRVIGDINQTFNETIQDIALDEPGGQVYVAFQARIVQVDLATEAVTTIADVDNTNLEAITAILFDPAGRLLIGDAGAGAIFTLELQTQAIEVLSQDGVRGAGPGFATVVSMSRVPGSQEIQVANQLNETVTTVNLDTGDRETLEANCGQGFTTVFPGLDQVYFNEAASELLIRGNSIYAFDVGSSDCAQLPVGLLSVLDIRTTPTNELLGATFGVLMQINRQSGEFVVISK